MEEEIKALLQFVAYIKHGSPLDVSNNKHVIMLKEYIMKVANGQEFSPELGNLYPLISSCFDNEMIILETSIKHNKPFALYLLNRLGILSILANPNAMKVLMSNMEFFKQFLVQRKISNNDLILCMKKAVQIKDIHPDVLQIIYDKSPPNLKSHYWTLWCETNDQNIARWLFDENKFDINGGEKSKSIAWLIPRDVLDIAEFKSVMPCHYDMFMDGIIKKDNHTVLTTLYDQVKSHIMESHLREALSKKKFKVFEVLYKKIMESQQSLEDKKSVIMNCMEYSAICEDLNTLMLVCNDIINIHNPKLIIDVLSNHLDHYTNFVTILKIMNPTSPLCNALFERACDNDHYDVARVLMLSYEINVGEYLKKAIYTNTSENITKIIKELAIKDFPKEVLDYLQNSH